MHSTVAVKDYSNNSCSRFPLAARMEGVDEPWVPGCAPGGRGEEAPTRAAWTTADDRLREACNTSNLGLACVSPLIAPARTKQKL